MSSFNSNEELQGFITLIRAMSGEQNVLENMEREGQQNAIRRVQLARNLQPNKEIWEQLGFKFYDIEGDNVLCNATLPEGWSLEATEHSMWTNILDEQGRIRGQMFYKAAFYDRSAHMSLKQRYNICTDYAEEKVDVYFGNDEEKLYVAGTITRSLNATREARLRFYEKEDSLRKNAINWAQENYPNYEDVTAYWDLPVKKYTKSRSKHQ